MKCTECGTGGARPVRVEYADGEREVLHLCDGCRRAFGDGDLVEGVDPLEEGG